MRYKSEVFNLKPKLIKYETVVILCGEGKHAGDFYFGLDLNLVVSSEPIKIPYNTLLKLYGRPQIMNLEKEYQKNFQLYSLQYRRDTNNKDVLKGVRDDFVVPGGRGDINIAVEKWPTNEIFWLPSSNLIEKLYYCSKTKNCYYQTDRQEEWVST